MSTVHQIAEPAPCLVRIEVFEGPLDLLLHLIKKHELDIFDIPISFIADRYLDYICTMQELQLDMAAEYLEMAATLAQIKSQMLLPQEPAWEEEGKEEQPDPREELVRRLLEYKKYKEAAKELIRRNILGRDTFTAEAGLLDTETRIVADVSVFDLMDLAARLIEKARAKGKEGPQLLADRITVAERITQIADLLHLGGRVSFATILGENFTVFDVVITFLAILEMVRLHMISIVQPEPFEDIELVPPLNYEPLQSRPAEPVPTAPAEVKTQTSGTPNGGDEPELEPEAASEDEKYVSAEECPKTNEERPQPAGLEIASQLLLEKLLEKR